MPSAHWQFLEMQRGDVNRDPIEGEFFNTEALDSMTDALVREVIQNSLDAALPSRTVRVRFFLSSSDSALPPARRLEYFDSLWPHLVAPQSGLQAIPDPREPVHYLLIEDFGTRGLGGDVTQYDDRDGTGRRKNDFYYFWRNVGRSGKESEDRGRWGLGKTVFQASSRINAFLGLTTREEDGHSYLMGQSVLKIHILQGRRFAPYGYFGQFEGTLPLPLADPESLGRFCGDFGIARNGQTGLSIVVPYPDPDIHMLGLIQSVIHHYFFPILAGDLAVEVCNGRFSETLDRESLREVVRGSRLRNRSDLVRLLDLALWGLSLPEGAHVALLAPEPGKAPKLREELFPGEMLAGLRQRFDRNERLALTIPLSVQERGGSELQRTGFRMYLQRDPEYDRCEDHFIRQGITIADVHSLRTRGVRAIVSITDRHLATFLGDSENPAHTQWERNNRVFKNRYTLAASTLDFVKTSTRNIAQILSQPYQPREPELLRQIFSVTMGAPEETKMRPEPEAADEGRQESGGETPEMSGGEGQALRLKPVRGGFRLQAASGEGAVPQSVAVYMAYEVRRGNPFARYRPLDFAVDQPPITLAATGARVIQCRLNLIQLLIERREFELTVTGYDPNRDLRVKVLPVGDPT